MRSARRQHDFQCVEDDVSIQAEGHVLDIEQVELQLFDGIFQIVAVSVVDLRPSGNSGPHAMPLPVIGDPAGVREIGRAHV